jgi:signal transduction histidine kinase
MNRWLVRYVLVLTYFSLLAVVFVVMSNWLLTANAVLAIPVLLGLSVVVALFPIRRPVLAGFERLTYGTRYSHRQILAEFADRIPAAMNVQELTHLLKLELAPQMEIRQSALLRRQDDRVETLYSQGVVLEERLATWKRTKAILQETENYLAAADIDDLASGNSLAWVRLAIPLRVKGRVTGAWLFGRRKNDDIYSEEDIELLDRLSGLVAVTLESSLLLDALSAELETRKAAEKRLAQQSQRLRMLHEIDQAVLAAGSPSEIAQSAFARLCQLVPSTRASVFLFEPELESMTILATQGSEGALTSDLDTIPFSEMPALEMLLQGQTFVENDMSKLADASRLASLLVPAGVRAVVSAPLLASGKAFGTLAVANSEPASFTKAHVAIVEEVATSIALAIHNARLRQEVDKSSKELRLLSARLIDAQETERKRLSHELHDEMGQLLTAISLKLAAVENRLSETDSQSLKELVSDADEFVVGLTNRVRSLSLELRPSMLRELGLVSTLRWFVANYSKRTEAEVHFEARDIPDHLPERVEITAYRVVQEALTNASRHSGATQIDLEVLGQNGNLQVMVGDNGQGFDLQADSNAEPTSAGLGLIMMRERVTAVNGRLDVSSKPGKGTIITARIPVEVEA